MKKLVREAKYSTYFVLDLHGLAKSEERDVVIGTAHGRTILPGYEYLPGMLTNALTAEGISNIAIDEKYVAKNPNTIASYTARELERTAMQIEIHRRYRNPRREPDNYLRLFRVLWSVVMSVIPPTSAPEESRKD